MTTIPATPPTTTCPHSDEAGAGAPCAALAAPLPAGERREGPLRRALALVRKVRRGIRHGLRPRHLEMVEEGVLYRSAYLKPRMLERVVRLHGIRTVVDLTPARRGGLERHRTEAGTCDRLGVRYVELPSRGRETPGAGQVATWVSLLGDPERRPVLVHCKHGVHRTGVLVAVYQMRFRGMSAEEAISRNPMFGHRDKPAMREFILRLAGEPEPGTEEARVAPVEVR